MKYQIWHFLLFVFTIPTTATIAQNKAIDVQHYKFAISLNDNNNIIQGRARIDFIVKKKSNKVYFDLVKMDESGKGMKVLHISHDQKELQFDQDNDHVNIYFDSTLTINQEEIISIEYEGIPADGLIIDTNKFAHRTYFADNWPNRAHNWIPCNDHPSDKASVEFIVTAPDHFQVIANGIKQEETNLPGHLKLTHWKEDMILPTKVMVIGVADFAEKLDSTIDCIPITSWVFPENRDSGFSQYAVSKNILPFFINFIGPYPYKKLANVQSKTIFGGMENASNIFYFQNSVAMNTEQYKRSRPLEALFAHETAHQWFGDEASEIDWPHVWLSEGFATYMTNLYMEYRYGTDILKRRMQHDRIVILQFYKKRKTPVVDFSSPDSLMLLLNPNSYEKGSWVLHMLRHKLGDEVFKKGIQNYYARFKGGNASTEDFMHVMEQVSKQNLELFFKQWLFTPGQPILDGYWQYNSQRKILKIDIQQMQESVFKFPLQIAIKGKQQVMLKTIDCNSKNILDSIPINFEPISIDLDPNIELLFDGNIKEKK